MAMLRLIVAITGLCVFIVNSCYKQNVYKVVLEL